MTRTTWILTALGIAGAFWDAAAAAPRRPVAKNDVSVTRRASDFFSRNGQATTDSASGTSGAGTVSLGGGAPKGETGAGFDPRLRPRLTTADAPEAEDVEFGSSSDEAAEPDVVEAMPNRLRIRPKTPGSVARVSASAAPAESDESETARTPSGDPLRRELSEEEESSGVVHAAGEDTLDELSGKIRAVRADAAPEENPFMPVEEFLKHKPRKTAASLPVSVSRPRSQSTNPEATAKTAAPSVMPKDEATEVAREPVPGVRTASGRGNVTETQAVKPNPRPSAAVAHQNETASVTAVSTAAVTPDSDETPRVSARWARRSEINVGQPSECELIVKNSGGVPANDVVVEAYFPKSVRLTSANPEPAEVVAGFSR